MQGDSFSNIGAGATIINRSNLTNSLNAARQNAGEDTANASQSVSEIVEKSGNADAADSLNEFNKSWPSRIRRRAGSGCSGTGSPTRWGRSLRWRSSPSTS